MYSLIGSIVNRLKLNYKTYIGNTKKIKLENYKDISIMPYCNTVNKNDLTIYLGIKQDDIIVKNIYGDLIKRDCTYDSTYMVDLMKRIRVAM